MKIAVVVGPFPVLSQTFILSQITGLIDRGHEVHVFASYPNDSRKVHSDVHSYNLFDKILYRPKVAKSNTILGRRFNRIGKGAQIIVKYGLKNPLVILKALNFLQYGQPAKSLELLFWAVPFISSDSYDIVHSHFGLYSLNCALLKKIKAFNGKLVVSFHGGDVNATPKTHGKDVYKPVFEVADMFTVNSNFTAQQAIGLGCPEEKIEKLPVGLNLSRYKPSLNKYKNGDTVKLLTVARLTEKKGIEYSIKAFSKATKNLDNVEYTIVGEGPLEAELKNLVNCLHISNKVKFVGSKTQAEILFLYEESHIFLLSSVTAKNGDREGQGLVLQEAQAMGLPIISTFHNGIPEGILDGKSGFLVPERDVDMLAEKISVLLDNPEIWSQMGEAGRSFVRQKFDIEHLNDRLVSLYENVLKS
ncbi:MAG: glycosyltransferase [Nodosilinea sp.]